MTRAQSAARLQALFDEQIPLSRAMQVSVASWDGAELHLSAPLAPSRNHHGSAFGGSLYTLGLLAGWGVLNLRLWAEGVEAQVVIQRAAADYLLPVCQALEARCGPVPTDEWERFLRRLGRRGQARLKLVSTILAEHREAFELHAHFVARNAGR